MGTGGSPGAADALPVGLRRPPLSEVLVRPKALLQPPRGWQAVPLTHQGCQEAVQEGFELETCANIEIGKIYQSIAVFFQHI